MDHGEAIRLGSTKKYVLGELPQSLCDEFEEHYFECQECALDLKAAAAFVDNAREVLREDVAKAVAKVPDPLRGRFPWFWLAVAVPAFAALLLVIAYQNAVTIPRIQEQAAHTGGQLFTSSFFLQMASMSGGEEAKVQVHPNESFALKFEFAPAGTFDSYLCQLQDEGGRSLLQLSIPGTSINKEAQLVIPGGRVKPGKHSVVFTGFPSSSVQQTGHEVLRLRIVIDFRK